MPDTILSVLPKAIRIGSRGSELALWQAHYVQHMLETLGKRSSVKIITTKGDNIQHLSFDKLEGKGFFTKEIEEALLANEIDLAVHSFKDMQTEPTPGLIVAATSYREDPADVLLIRNEVIDKQSELMLPAHAIVGTSSARRKAAIRMVRPDVELKDIRGNVPTRVQKLRDGHFDAILLAAAGLNRLALDLTGLHTIRLDPTTFIPAPAQGVLAWQCREGDEELIALLQKMADQDVAQSIAEERDLLRSLHGGCQLPFGAYCVQQSGQHHLFATLSDAQLGNTRSIHLCAEQSHHLAADALALLTAEPAALEVFVSKAYGESSKLQRHVKAMGHNVTAYPLISFAMTGQEMPKGTFDWLFFASPTAVDYFVKLEPTFSPMPKVAALGYGTAQRLAKHEIAIDYIGSKSDTFSIGESFAQKNPGARVLIPGPEKKSPNIRAGLSTACLVTDWPIYQTTALQLPAMPAHDVYVFTSESNVDACFAHHTPPARARFVAMGNATRDALLAHGVASENIKMPYYFTEEHLAQEILTWAAQLSLTHN